MNLINSNKNQNSNQNSIINKKAYLKFVLFVLSIIFIVLAIISIIDMQKISKLRQEIKILSLKLAKNKPNLLSSNNENIDKSSPTKIDKNYFDSLLNQIKNFSQTPKIETDLVLHIYKLVPKNISLQSIAINNNQINISGSSLVAQIDEKIINKIVKKISKLPKIKSTNLKSIQKNKDKITFQIFGELKNI